MAEDVWRAMAAQLRERGIAFDAGLSDSEATVVESRLGIRFPPGLRAFLQTALPRGKRFPDWRSGDEAALRDWLDRPRQPGGVPLDELYRLYVDAGS